MSYNPKKFSGAMREGLEVADNITTSVLALAIASGIKADALAKIVNDPEALAFYRNDVAVALQRLFVAEAVEAEKEEKKAKKA